jgi:hypothetical protein
MKTRPVSTFLLLAVTGGALAGAVVLSLTGCENKGGTPPAASPADASSGATAAAPSSAPAQKPTAGGGGW